MNEQWLSVLSLVGPMAGSVLSMVILVVPIVWGLLRFLGKAQDNDVKTARVLERLSVSLTGLPKLIGAEVAGVMQMERNQTLNSDTYEAIISDAMATELDAANNLSDEETRALAVAEIHRRYRDG